MKPSVMWIAVLVLGVTACSGGGQSVTLPGGKSQTTSGSAATLSDDKGSLQIPDGSFPSKMTVTMNSDVANTADIGQAQPISSPITLDFSDVAMVTGDTAMSLTLQLDPDLLKQAIADGKAIYAKIKIEGGNLSSDTGTDGASEWMPILGDVDREKNTLTLNLFASAATINAVAVVGNELRLSAPKMPRVRANKSVTARKGAAKLDILGQHKWIVVCEKEGLSDNEDATCNTIEFDPAMGMGKSPILDLREKLDSYSMKLRDQGLNTVLVNHTTIKNILSSNLQGTPTSDELKTMDEETIFNVAFLTNSHVRCNDIDAVACYLHSIGALVFGEEFDDPPVLANGGDVISHEMTHAVQAQKCPSCNTPARTNKAFMEGTADLVGNYYYVNANAAAIQERVDYGRARSWDIPLSINTKTVLPYKTFEFYALALEGKIDHLASMFTAFEGANGQTFGQRLDAAVKNATPEDFQLAFIKAVALRDYDSINKPNYTVAISPANWSAIIGSVRPLSAVHYLFNADFAGPCQISETQLITGSSDLVMIVVFDHAPFDGNFITMDLGNGKSAYYVTDRSDMDFDRTGLAVVGQCAMDVIIANTSLTGDPDVAIDFSLKTGFD